LNNKELNEKFIRYFDEDKYKFENFCKIFLKWLDFDDIQVTNRVGDGGIDLRCSKREIEQMNLNIINYVVQAKCYSLSHKVTPSDIRDFRGTRTDMSVRKIFITTSDYTRGAIEEAEDGNQPIILINGEKLIEFCKSYNDTMFDVKYYFNKQKLDDLFRRDDEEFINNQENRIEKRITRNDVRARILRIPSEYKNIIANSSSYKLAVNGDSPKKYNISSDKVYFGGVTELYRDFISNADFQEGHSVWWYDSENKVFHVSIN